MRAPLLTRQHCGFGSDFGSTVDTVEQLTVIGLPLAFEPIERGMMKRQWRHNITA